MLPAVGDQSTLRGPHPTCEPIRKKCSQVYVHMHIHVYDITSI